MLKLKLKYDFCLIHNPEDRDRVTTMARIMCEEYKKITIQLTEIEDCPVGKVFLVQGESKAFIGDVFKPYLRSNRFSLPNKFDVLRNTKFDQGPKDTLLE